MLVVSTSYQNGFLVGISLSCLFISSILFLYSIEYLNEIVASVKPLLILYYGVSCQVVCFYEMNREMSFIVNALVKDLI